MAIANTVTTVEDLTLVATSGGAGTAGPTNVFVPSGAEIGRYRIRVLRTVFAGATAGDTVTVIGTTPTASGTETQTLAILTCTGATTIVQGGAVDQVSFPDEHEFRGKITITVVLTSGTCNTFFHHG